MSPIRTPRCIPMAPRLAGLICIVLLLIVPAVSASTTSVQILKYARDGTTVLNSTNVTAQWMEMHLPVLGDGKTHYYHQGPVFEDSTDPAWREELRWNREESKSVQESDMGALKGTNLRDLCNLVGGMGPGDTVTLYSIDGTSREFAFSNVYQYTPRQGPMVVTWFRDGEGKVPSFGEGMKLVFFADNSTNPFGLHVFGNNDWRESAPRSSWYYLIKGTEKYPETTGLALPQITTIRINSILDPPGSLSVLSEPPGAAIILDGKPAGSLTPATLDSVEPGTHNIMVTREGFQDPEPVSVIITSHQTSQVTFSLSPETSPELALPESLDTDNATKSPTTPGTIENASLQARQPASPTTTEVRDRRGGSGMSLIDSLLTGVRSGFESIVSAVVTSFEAGQVVRDEDIQQVTNSTSVPHPAVTAGTTSRNRAATVTPGKTLSVPPATKNISKNISLAISSDPPGATIFLDKSDTGRLTPNTIAVTGGVPHSVELVLEGYIPYSQEVNLTGDRAMNVSLIALVVPEDNLGTLSGGSSPADEAGSTPGVSGEEIGTPLNISMDVFNNPRAVLDNPSHHGAVYITSYPNNCEVYINNRLIKGKTPTLVCALKEGSNLIRVQTVSAGGESAASISRNVWVYPDAITTAYFPVGIPDAYDSITITSSVYNGESFTVDGIYPEKKIPSGIEARDPGSYVTVLKDDAYYSYLVPIRLISGESFELTNWTRALHTLKIESLPAGAEVFIDGVRTGYVTPCVISGLSDGPHRIMLSLKGYIPQDRLITIPINDEVAIKNPETFILLSYPTGDLLVDSLEPGAAIYLNGFATGEVTPYTFQGLLTGTYEVYLVGKDFTGKRRTITTQRSVEADRLNKCIINLNLI